MKLERISDKPILTPSNNWWENKQVFNPGVTIFEDKIILLYRAVGNDTISRFGLATSKDGLNFERFDEPIFEGSAINPYERLGVEDPRITKFGDEYLIFYTGASVYPIEEVQQKQNKKFSKTPWRIRTFLTKTKDFKSFSHEEIELHFDSKDSALFPEKISDKYVLFHRVYPTMNLIYSDNLKLWGENRVLLEPRTGKWDSERLGVGAPPFKTEKGWLVFYHGVDVQRIYRLGVFLLDLDDPTKVVYRGNEPIFEPETIYEKEGVINNVVFACGAVERDGKYMIYYGAADKVVGGAMINKEALLDSININES